MPFRRRVFAGLLVLAAFASAVPVVTALPQLDAPRQQQPEGDQSAQPQGDAENPISDAEFRTPVSSELAREIQELLPKLAAPSFDARRTASDRLVEIGVAAFAILRDHYKGDADLEARLRIEDIVRQAYMNHHLYDRTSFLGVSFNPQFSPSHEDYELIPPGHRGLMVQAVIPGTGAARAGLGEEAIIIALDGVLIDQLGPADPGTAFSRKIRAMPPGTKVTLTIITAPPLNGSDRQRTKRDIEVTLQRRPENQYGDVTGSVWVQQTRTRFLVWWDTYFLGLEEAGAPSPEMPQGLSPDAPRADPPTPRPRPPVPQPAPPPPQKVPPLP